ncbi:PLP-dependent aminotransferase family protein (plasmid) [Burkholderia sp. FERM BP-3421]|uniref:MocR-like pyridoxine biosynthesis transcription factor PdxR n=1 Tax=Burkholderia sp. FERM BP-3421 TaxID=1494466 RepID=UPI002361BF18|nr:PLP-dependent aminotransferase family protein [Burkholderia sp. FERM BP-3421]WDD90238.1 PLP-dependent aminotransferase family protein [Burkholderia sp. FERM BP-3421]
MRDVLLSDLLIQNLSRESGHSLQRQLYDLIRRGILDRILTAGQKLPSTRALAVELGISRITVSLVYERLAAESYVLTVSGSGTFIADIGIRPGADAARASNTDRSPLLSRRGGTLARGRGGISQPGGAFVPGVADAEWFPFHVWRRLVTRHLNKSDLSLAGYSREGAGFLPLREAIASYLRIARSVVCTAEQVIVTSGTHQSIDLCARMLADIGDSAMVEDPCHWAFPSVLAASGLRVAAGQLDEAGLDLESSRVPKRLRLVVTSPSHQYPTGVVMPLVRRIELLRAASRRGVWIIEDDYDSEFRYDGMPIPSLQGLDDTANVIYMGTFSKATYPGMRVAYMVVPPHVARAFSHACAEIYRPGMLHQQAALADFIADGHLVQHIRRMREEYARRQQALRAALHRELGGAIEPSQARAGLHVFSRLRVPVSAAQLASEAMSEGIVLGMPHFVSRAAAAAAPAVVLGYGGVPIDRIDAGVTRLARAFDRARRAPILAEARVP